MAVGQTLFFGFNSTQATGAHPVGIATGELNADGIPDIVTSNATGVKGKTINTISVLIGKFNDAGFYVLNGKNDFTVGLDPQGIALGDLTNTQGLGFTDPNDPNNNRIPAPIEDIIVANAESNTISVLMGNVDKNGNANGDFNPKTETTYFVGQVPEEVAVGDLNGDGFPDVVVTNELDNDVSILLNDGLGDGGLIDFQTVNNTIVPAAPTYAVGSEPIGLTLADVNGDGKLDIIVTNSHDNNVSILLGNGDGTFKPQVTFAVGNKPISVAAADLNGDGSTDLVTTNYDSNTISVLINNSNGTFQPQETIATGNAPADVAIGDANGDTIPELFVTNSGDNNVGVYVGNGDGTYETPQNFAVGNEPMGIVTVFNNTLIAGPGQVFGSFVSFVNTDFSDNNVEVTDNTFPPFAFTTGTAPNQVLHVNGTIGNDTIAVSAEHGQLTATLNGFNLAANNNVPFLIANVGSISVEGFDGSDQITIGARVPGGLVVGDTGNDTIISLNDVTDSLIGGAGSDSITANNLAGDDLMNGGQGADTIVAGTGQVTIHGGKGTDSIVGGAGSDVLVGGGGADTIIGSIHPGVDLGFTFIAGGPGSDSLMGGPDDTLVGGASGGQDTLVFVSS